MIGKRIFEKERVSVVWAASCDRNFGGMLENSFEHSEIRIAFQQAASEGTTKKIHICKHINYFYKKSGKVSISAFFSTLHVAVLSYRGQTARTGRPLQRSVFPTPAWGS